MGPSWLGNIGAHKQKQHLSKTIKRLKTKPTASLQNKDSQRETQRHHKYLLPSPDAWSSRALGIVDCLQALAFGCTAEPNNLMEKTALQIHFTASEVTYFLLLPHLCGRSCFPHEMDIY